MTGTLEATTIPDLDWSDFTPTCPLGDTHWQVWGVGLLRSAGFPVSGWSTLGGPRAALASAEHRERGAEYDAFKAVYDADALAESEQFAGIAGNELFRRAIAWQNSSVFRILDGLVSGKSHGSDRRRRERTMAMYWTRYCAKADTIGFFGPAAWISAGRIQQALAVEPGPSLVSGGRVFFERWAVAELAEWMAGQPGARWWFPPMLRPDVHLDGARLLLPNHSVVRLREDEVDVLAYADGDRNGEGIVDALVAERQWDAATARPRAERTLSKLQRQRVLTWDSNIPVDVRAEAILRKRVSAIGDPDLFVRFEAVLEELDRLRDEIGRAQDSGKLTEALSRLDEFFVETTGSAASHEQGKMYAGRSLCYQDMLRDIKVSVGRDFFDHIAAPLALVSDTADWFANHLAELVEAEVVAMVRKVAAQRATVTLADVWTQVLALFWGDNATPVHAATRDLALKWREVLDLDPADQGNRVQLSVADIEDRVRSVFATGRRWPHLAVHSPDLQIVAASVDAVNAGDYTVVLGELHASLASLDMPFLDWTLDRDSLRDKINTGIGAPRLVPLLPTNWRRNSGRMIPTSFGVGDRLIGFTRAPFDDRTRVDPASAIKLSETDGQVTATTPDGRTWRIPELLGVPISIIAADAFKIGIDRPHAPRITLDDLVLFRETWRVPVASIALPPKADRHRDYLAVRRWVADHALPDQAFVKFPEEIKPSLVDFTSPTLVLSFANLARTARQIDPDAVVSLSEPLPDAGGSWLPDADGLHYISELRLQISRKAPE